MKPKSLTFVVLSILGIGAILAGLWIGRDDGNRVRSIDPPSEAASTGSPGTQKDQVSGSGPIEPVARNVDLSLLPTDFVDELNVHQARADQRIALLRKESLTESLARLTDDQWYLDPGVHSPVMFEQLDLEMVLSSRRYHKVREDLSGLSQEQRKALLTARTNEILESLHGAYDTIAASYLEPGAPKNDRSILGLKLALTAIVMLSTEYGFTDLINEAFSRSDSITADMVKRIRLDEDRYPAALVPAIEANGSMQPVVRLNAILTEVESNADRLNADQTRQLQSIRDRLVRKRIEIAPWEARVNAYDAVHLLEAEPLDRRLGSREYVYYNWSSHERMHPEDQSLLIGQLQAMRQDR